MRKFPTSVTIGGLVFKIKYISAGKGKPLQEGEAGCINVIDQRIYIEKSLPYAASMITLLHEFLHAIGDVSCPNKNVFAKEEVTSITSQLLFQALTSAKLLK